MFDGRQTIARIPLRLLTLGWQTRSVWFFCAGRFRTSKLLGHGVEDIRIALVGASNMVKYFLGWILGVPVIVLVIIYILFN